MVLLETRDVHAQIKVQRNKTHNNDTLPLGGSHVHVESAASFSVRLLLTHRRTLKRKFLDLENEIRHSLKVFRVKQSAIRRADSEAQVCELIGADALLAALTGWSGRRGQEYTRFDSLLVRTVDRTSSAGDSRRCGAWVRRGCSRSRRRSIVPPASSARAMSVPLPG
jgi:transposase